MTAASRLAEIEARCQAATEGPWEWDGRRVPTLNGAAMNDSYVYEVIEAEHDGGCACRRACELALNISSEDRAFIAAAREDLPALVAFARDVEALLDAAGTFAGIGGYARRHDISHDALTAALARHLGAEREGAGVEA